VIREALRVLAAGEPRLLFLGQPDQHVPEGVTFVPISCQSEGALQVYIEPVLPAPHLVVAGDSPMTRVLTAMAAALGWRTGGEPGAGSMVVVATQGHGDEEALEQALATRPAYVGLVASRRRGATVLGYLTDRGVEGIDQVRVPAGLDLGATTHEEIAVAILAELVKLRASGALSPPGALAPEALAPEALAPEALGPGALGPGAAMSQRRPSMGSDESAMPLGPAHTDPVCGMSVSGDAYSMVRDGVTYRFCCAGCRHAFEESEARC